MSPRGRPDRHDADGDPLQRMVRTNDSLLVRVVAWLVIAALVLGGGAVLFSALAR